MQKVESRLKYSISGGLSFAFTGAIIGICGPLAALFITRLFSGAPLPDEQIAHIQNIGNITMIAFPIIGSIFGFLFANWIYPERMAARRKQQEAIP